MGLPGGGDYKGVNPLHGTLADAQQHLNLGHLVNTGMVVLSSAGTVPAETESVPLHDLALGPNEAVVVRPN